MPKTEYDFENAPCGYLSFDPAGTITRINKMALKWTKLRKEDILLKKKLEDITDKGTGLYFQMMLYPLLRMQGYINELSVNIISADGEATSCLFNASAVGNADGSIRQVHAILFNISDRKKYETEILKAREMADSVVLHKEQILQAQRRIMSILGHDTRAPLFSINRIIKYAADGKLSAEEIFPYFELISNQLDATLILIEDLLKWSNAHFENKPSGEAPYSLQSVVDDVFSLLNNNALAKGLFLKSRIDASITMLFNSSIITFILRNLVNNAVKYTSKGGITVSATAAAGMISIEVSDTGVGMTPDQLEKYTTGGLSSVPGTENEKGSGMGVMLINEFILQLNGTLLAESVLGEGTRVTVMIPGPPGD